MVQKKLLAAGSKPDQVLTQSDMVYVTVFNEQGVLVGDEDLQIEKGYCLVLYQKK